MNEPKITGSEIYFLLAFALLSDAINWIPFINFFVTAVTLPGYWFYFNMKGVPTGWSLGGNLAEFIPFISFLPAVTAGVLVTILIDHFGGKTIKRIGKLTAK